MTEARPGATAQRSCRSRRPASILRFLALLPFLQASLQVRANLLAPSSSDAVLHTGSSSASDNAPSVIALGNTASSITSASRLAYEAAVTGLTTTWTRRLRQHSVASPPAARVVVVNDIPSHFEVLASVLVQLRRLQQQQPGLLEPQPRVTYTGNPRGPIDNGLQDWLGPDVTGTFRWFPLNAPGMGATGGIGGQLGQGDQRQGQEQQQQQQQQPESQWPAPADLVLCVSAELAPKVCRSVVNAVRPPLLVMMVHRADALSPNARILSLHANFKLMALAPHVANLSRHMLRHPVDWAMPIAPYNPPQPCNSKGCLRGFSIQGALRRFKSKHGNGFTRDYSGLWQRLLQLRAAGQELPRVVVLGKGQRSDLMVPLELDERVEFHPWLRYPDFWSLIHHSYALVPAFGMPVYYESRISSTILASLLTCVPVIAEQRLLDTYTFIREEHVFLRQPGEDEAAAMLRVMQLPEEALFAKRAAVCELQRDMNARADGLLAAYLRKSVSAGPAGGAAAAVAAVGSDSAAALTTTTAATMAAAATTAGAVQR